MDFFLDTGPIYGWAATNDKSHHHDCVTLFKMYPVDVHGYYTTKSIVEDELKNLRRKRLHGASQLIRLIERRCREVLSKIKDADYTGYPEYPLLSHRILTLLDSMKIDTNPKDKDAACSQTHSCGKAKCLGFTAHPFSPLTSRILETTG